MEKSEWHLKNIRYKGQQLKRLDDFVAVYKNTHLELLREFSDTQCMTESKVRHQLFYSLNGSCITITVIKANPLSHC